MVRLYPNRTAPPVKATSPSSLPPPPPQTENFKWNDDNDDIKVLEYACDLWWFLWKNGEYRRPPYINIIGWRTAANIVESFKSPKPFQVTLGPIFPNLFSILQKKQEAFTSTVNKIAVGIGDEETAGEYNSQEERQGGNGGEEEEENEVENEVEEDDNVLC